MERLSASELRFLGECISRELEAEAKLRKAELDYLAVQVIARLAEAWR